MKPKKSNKKLVLAKNYKVLYEYSYFTYFGYQVLNRASGQITDEELKKSNDPDFIFQKRKKNRYLRFLRAKKKVYDLVSANIKKGTRFITLTYKENETDIDKAMEDFRLFIKDFNEYLFGQGGKLEYIAVIEFQERGAIHFHFLAFNIPWVDSLFEDLEFIWYHGDTNVKYLKDKDVESQKLGGYLSKYFSKFSDEDSRLDGRKCYFTSRNLDRPKYFRDENIILRLTQKLYVDKIEILDGFNKLYLKNDFGNR